MLEIKMERTNLNQRTILEITVANYNNDREHSSMKMVPSKLHFYPTEEDLFKAEKNQAKAWRTRSISLEPG